MTDDSLLADPILSAMDEGRLLPPPWPALPDDLAAARRIQTAVNARRLARGESAVGFKIGFTNRAIWPLYGVFQPIWAPVWQRGLVDAILPDGETVARFSGGPRTAAPPSATSATGWFDPEGRLALGRLCQPRLEPEIVVGLGRTPASSAVPDVAAAVAWVAHGFEIVHSIWPDWKFTAAQGFAAQSLHGALLVGPRRRVRDPAALAALLGAVRLELACDGRPVATGDGTAVLDGPIQALAHLVDALGQAEPGAAAPTGIADATRSLGAGSIVTTGTLTDAQPLVPGQRWQTRVTMPAGTDAVLDGPLIGLELRT